MIAAERAGLVRAREAIENGSRGGLTRDKIVGTVINLHEPDSGEWPTQEVVAEKLDCSERRLRQLQGTRGWGGILEDARARIDEGA